MKYSWIEEYCLLKKGAEKDFKAEWNAIRYRIKGKMFALQGGNQEGKPIITLKLEPSHGMALREKYQEITPRILYE